ncbi:D,D-heptose 1,7-bisphosphate phosphatase [Methylacidimicrobium sp. AP8]|uniref:D-glycero-alpha-D-manno-heptose-1,7-bisphosphate 7-phosphatase n=1 Tax=Methylacidimicrobium sp. AP8 TaxID=2730359 RepID=UPI0018BFC9CF|nr:HAD-IIIA family hydrolase [Methylacidimicrobium sp. AP8]CAB4243426.1 D,D-heptose 1,7-bisphosphate phosphatase [Methylacidimicrobium sp. AP8]
MKRRAVFFDRDDTLIKNFPYLGDPEKIVLAEGAKESLARLRDAGFLLFLVSNQSGVGRGWLRPQDVEAVNRSLQKRLEISFAKIYLSFAAPDNDPLGDRKPSPLLLWRAAAEFDIALRRSYFVGDRIADVLCGRNAGCRTVLLADDRPDPETERAAEWARNLADRVVPSLPAAADWILASTDPA